MASLSLDRLAFRFLAWVEKLLKPSLHLPSKLSDLWRPQCRLDQLFANRDLFHMVHAQRQHASATGWCHAENHRAFSSEVLGPPIRARVEQAHNSAGLMIKSAQIRPLVSIAAKTGIGEVRQRIGASMLNWYDVFNFEKQIGRAHV